MTKVDLKDVYAAFAKRLSKDALHEMVNANLRESGVPVLGDPIKYALYTFKCPELGVVQESDEFNVHGNLSPETGELEAVLTVTCNACGAEHPVLAISFPKLLTDSSEVDNS